MHTLMVAFYLLLSLVGCGNFGAQRIVTQASEQGVEVLRSEASITPLQARFFCVRSASSSCHYRIVSGECRNAAGAAPSSACAQTSLRQFVVAAGRSEALTDLPAAFSFCVDQLALPIDASCRSGQHSGFSL